MTDLHPKTDFADPQVMSRVAKIAIDNGDVVSISEAYELLQTYQVGIRIGPEVADSYPHQAALLTLINIASRTLLGGVFVAGPVDASLRLSLPGFSSLESAITGLGGTIVDELDSNAPVIALGTVADEVPSDAISISVTFDGWRGGVVVSKESRLAESSMTIAPAATLAAGLAMSEVFQWFRGNPMAGRRDVGLSLWQPDSLDWEAEMDEPKAPLYPSKLWLLGLGHLGQAYLWTLGLLPYADASQVELVLQDFDDLATSNISTSLLTNPELVGQKKTRAMGHWAEQRGFRTKIIERVFSDGMKVHPDEPNVLLGGVDNAAARACYEDAGFDWIVESGLGSGPIEYLTMRINTFPASRTARSKWGDVPTFHNPLQIQASAYNRLAQDGMDQCGLLQLATRTVGASFVGTVAASLAVSEIMRRLHGGISLEVLDLNLRDSASRESVRSSNDHRVASPAFTN